MDLPDGSADPLSEDLVNTAAILFGHLSTVTGWMSVKVLTSRRTFRMWLSVRSRTSLYVIVIVKGVLSLKRRVRHSPIALCESPIDYR